MTADPKAMPGFGALDPEAMKKTSDFVKEKWVEMGTEAMRFVADRLKSDADTQQALLNCKSIEDLQAVQADFFRKTMDQYSTESVRMMGMMNSMTEGLMEGSPLAPKPATKPKAK